MKFHTVIDGKKVELEFSENMDRLIFSNEKEQNIDCVPLSKNFYSLILNGRTHTISIKSLSGSYEVTVDHQRHIVQVKDDMDILLEQFGMKNDLAYHAGEIHAQIPGLVCQMFVNEGDEISVGQKLFILEAMKMENEIDSPVGGKIKTIHITPGKTVEKGDLIMEITN